MSSEQVAILFFVALIVLLMSGFPVAFVLGGLSVIIGMIMVPDFLDFLPLRIMGTLQNYVLLAVPLFVFMGLTLEKSGIAEKLLTSMGIDSDFHGPHQPADHDPQKLFYPSGYRHYCKFGHVGANHSSICRPGPAGKCAECSRR